MSMSSIPTFLGFYNAANALVADQAQLATINNNITNANTPGYSNQSVELGTAEAYEAPGIDDDIQSGQLGQGVIVQGVTRSSNEFLNAQINTQSSAYNYQNTLENTLTQVQNVLGESGSSGSTLQTAMDNFFSDAQALSANPSDYATRTAFVQSASSMLASFQQVVGQIQTVQDNISGNPANASSISQSQVGLSVSGINSDLKQLASLNTQIATVEASGASPNDLLDQQDQLISTLSAQAGFTFTRQGSDQVSVSLGGNTLVNDGQVVDTLNTVANPTYSSSSANGPALVELNSSGAILNSSIISSGGQLGAMLEATSNDATTMTTSNLMSNLNTLFDSMATQVNTLQSTGYDNNGTMHSADTESQLFVGTPGSTVFGYSMNANIEANPNTVAAASNSTGSFAGPGDGSNAASIAALQTSTTLAGLGGSSPGDFLNQSVSNLGSDIENATSSATTLNSTVEQLTQLQQSVQGVNINTQMANLLQFQQSMEASSKVLSVLNTTLQDLLSDYTG